jgi:hypothetical protein
MKKFGNPGTPIERYASGPSAQTSSRSMPSSVSTPLGTIRTIPSVARCALGRCMAS